MENTTALSMFDSTVKYSGENIFVKPFCDFFQIDYDNQCRIINNSVLLKKLAGKNTSTFLFGDNFKRVTLSKRGFISWILQINPQIVQVNLKEKLLQYQELIFDYMFGVIEFENKTKLAYTRLNKLKRLQSRIKSEINKSEKEIQGYLCSKFGQIKLELIT
jgi:hypothetical protein